MTLSTRRRFFQTALATGAALPFLPATSGAIEPIVRKGPSHLRLSMAAYSYRKYLDLKAKPKPEWTLDDFIDNAAELNIDAVELTAYYFPETTPEYLARIKSRCSRLGLDVSGTAIGNNFCHTDPAKHKEELEYVRQWIEHSARLGAKTIRIFAGNLEKDDTEEKARGRVVEAIQESCDLAAKHGLYLALENHGGITSNIDQMLTLVKAVKHDAFGVNFDTGNFRSADPYADLEKLASYAVVCQIKKEIQRAGKEKEDADLKRMTEILRAVKFRGYIALEYESAEEPKTAIPEIIANLKKLMG